MIMASRLFSWLVVALVMGNFQSYAAKPNVVLLVTDDQRADTISALGNPIIKTPNLDALATSGFVFRNAYCMGSTMGAVCNPSRHMLLSGMSLYRYNPEKKEGTFADVMNNDPRVADRQWMSLYRREEITLAFKPFHPLQ